MTQNLESFQLISLNVNGLNDVRKRRLTFNYLRKFKKAILLLQETHCKPGNGRLWKSQWGGPLFLTEASSNTGGVATLFSKDLNPTFTRITPSKFNRFLITEFSLMGEDYKVVNSYMPTANKESLQLEVLEELTPLITRNEEALTLWGGDFNVSFNPAVDQQGYAKDDIPNKRFREELKKLLENLDLGDIWRIQNPRVSTHTWARLDHFSRLDYTFAPINFPGSIKAYEPKTVPFSDHRLIGLKFRPCSVPKGKGFWKLKTALLHNEQFCEEIVETIEEGALQADILSPQMKWEFIKFAIRDCAIKFEKKRKEQQNKLEAELETQLLVLEKDLYNSDQIQEEYQLVKRELYQIQLARTRESMIRSRVRWVGEGERPSKYFLNLERKNYESKIISSLVDDQENVITDHVEILQMEKSYFSKQYALNQHNLQELEAGHGVEFLQHNTNLPEMDKTLLNRDLSGISPQRHAERKSSGE